MIVKEYEYIRGNTAAQPRRSSEPDRKRYEELQKAKRERKEKSMRRSCLLRKMNASSVIHFWMR